MRRNGVSEEKLGGSSTQKVSLTPRKQPHHCRRRSNHVHGWSKRRSPPPPSLLISCINPMITSIASLSHEVSFKGRCDRGVSSTSSTTTSSNSHSRKQLPRGRLFQRQHPFSKSWLHSAAASFQQRHHTIAGPFHRFKIRSKLRISWSPIPETLNEYPCIHHILGINSRNFKVIPSADHPVLENNRLSATPQHQCPLVHVMGSRNSRR